MFGGGAPGSGSGDVEDIPREELLALCMKMNKRMQAMEIKGKELVRKKGTLLEERHLLLDWIVSDINSTNNSSLAVLSNAVSVMNGKDNEGDLDISVITASFEKWVR